MGLDPKALEQARRAIGVLTGPLHYEIEKGHVRRFAEAAGVPILEEDGSVIAPPTFLRTCLLPPPPVDFAGVTGLQRVLEGGSEWEFHHPVRSGDSIAVAAEVKDVREREGRLGTMLITSTLATYADQRGQVMATQLVHRILY